MYMMMYDDIWWYMFRLEVVRVAPKSLPVPEKQRLFRIFCIFRLPGYGAIFGEAFDINETSIKEW